MKALLIMILASTLLTACAKDSDNSSGLPAAAEALGNEGANGGSSEAQAIARLSGEMLLLVSQTAQTYPEINMDQLRKVVETTKLFLQPMVVIDGKELDATNNGKDTIRISQVRWQQKTDRLVKMALLLHEYLGILGLEKDSYGISNRVLNPMTSISLDTEYECTGWHKVSMKVRYDLISDLFIFTLITDYPEEGRFIGSYWNGNFYGQQVAPRRLKGNLLSFADGSYPPIDSNPGLFRQMYFQDNQGILLVTGSNLTLACTPKK